MFWVQDFRVTLAVLGLLARGWSSERHYDPHIVGIHVLRRIYKALQKQSNSEEYVYIYI